VRLQFEVGSGSAPQTYSSCPDLIRASINLRDRILSKWMDHRVKPGDDKKKTLRWLFEI
jgi:hypothetical protein